jgi:hypothetical protein
MVALGRARIQPLGSEPASHRRTHSQGPSAPERGPPSVSLSLWSFILTCLGASPGLLFPIFTTEPFMSCLEPHGLQVAGPDLELGILAPTVPRIVKSHRRPTLGSGKGQVWTPHLIVPFRCSGKYISEETDTDQAVCWAADSRSGQGWAEETLGF